MSKISINLQRDWEVASNGFSLCDLRALCV